MKAFQFKISMECANKPVSVGLKRNWGWEQDSTKRNLVSHSGRGLHQLRHPWQESWGLWQHPFHLLTGTSSADSSQACRSLPKTGIWAHPIPTQAPMSAIWPLYRGLFVGSTRVTNFSLSFWAGNSYLSHRESRYIGILLLECLGVQLPKTCSSSY